MGFRLLFGSGFRDRRDAGRQLAELLSGYGGRSDVVVLALPRGGVTVGREVADALDVPMFAFVVHKLGAPGNPELAIGALTSDGTCLVDSEIVSDLDVPEEYVEAEKERQQAEIDRRVEAYGAPARVPDVGGKTVIVVDDGIATGSTVRAAIRSLRVRRPAELVLAVPVGARDVLARLARVADRVIAVQEPEHLFGVGTWYDDFRQVTDDEVVSLLADGDERA